MNRKLPFQDIKFGIKELAGADAGKWIRKNHLGAAGLHITAIPA
jgi:hypothetical protein